MNLAASFGVSINRTPRRPPSRVAWIASSELLRSFGQFFRASRDVGLRYRLASFPSGGSSRQDTPHQDAQHQDHPGSGGDGDGAASSARAANASRVGSQRCVARKHRGWNSCQVIDDRDAGGILGRMCTVLPMKTWGTRCRCDREAHRRGSWGGHRLRWIPRRRKPQIYRRRLERVALSNQRTDGPHHPGADPRPGQAGPRDQSLANLCVASAWATYNPTRKLQRLSTNFARRPTTARRSTIGPGEG